MSLLQEQKVDTWRVILGKLFKRTSMVLIEGKWKTGKTAFALFLAEKLLEYKYVSEVASNIDTQGTFLLINDTHTLKEWLSSSKRLKLFIFDEANELLPNTGFMKKENISFKAIIPQISKRKGRLIVIGHDISTIDKTLKNSVWCRGVFKKRNLKTAILTAYWNTHKPINIYNIPNTKIPFDPELSASWQDRPDKLLMYKNEKLQKMYEYAFNGKNYKDLGYTNRETLRRDVKATLKYLFALNGKEGKVNAEEL
jgi:hypothetical protein